MRALTKTALILFVLSLAAAPAAAQAPGVDFKLNPRIGLYVPLTDLGELSDGTEVAMDNSLAIGLGAELQLAALPFGIRANLDYATSSSVNFESGSLEESADATLLAVAADLVFRPLPRVVVLQPYLFVGGGLKQYDIEIQSAEVESFRDESDPTVHLGGGLDLGLGPLALNAEVGDYISWAEFTDDSSEMQHDLFVTVGFSIGML